MTEDRATYRMREGRDDWPPYHLVMDGHLRIDWMPLTDVGREYMELKAENARLQRALAAMAMRLTDALPTNGQPEG